VADLCSALMSCGDSPCDLVVVETGGIAEAAADEGFAIGKRDESRGGVVMSRPEERTENVDAERMPRGGRLPRKRIGCSLPARREGVGDRRRRGSRSQRVIAARRTSPCLLWAASSCGSALPAG
jgi:hypothetical protein